VPKVERVHGRALFAGTRVRSRRTSVIASVVNSEAEDERASRASNLSGRATSFLSRLLPGHTLCQIGSLAHNRVPDCARSTSLACRQFVC